MFKSISEFFQNPRASVLLQGVVAVVFLEGSESDLWVEPLSAIALTSPIAEAQT
jgi:hypothetical protein